MRSTHAVPFLAIAWLATACSSNSSTPTCDALVSEPQLLYPIPGSTGVSDAAGVLILAGAPVGPISMMASAGGPAVALGSPTAASSPLPSPLAATPFPQSSPYAISYAPLATGTTYAVSGVTGGCARDPQSLGSFTTR